MAARALLLDRDGVVNVDHGYVGTVERFAFMDGILPLARRAVDLGYRIAIATNQSGIARDRYGEAEFQALTGWMAERFAAAGAPLAAVFHCPYLPGAAVPAYDRDSVWRKPSPGMILEAERRLGLDLARSVFIGDQPTDMAAARAAGVGLRLLLDHSAPPCVDAHAVISTLAEAERFLTPPAASRPA
ncbi:HAD family hydrolase [Azospirillum sp. RWY-5-1]|uniref:D,D-heptose 1,7-bisphosphate phosphatase n=1 Tax=Azospirillum oleiclasticum TaxID=2735135 RepID=A0ABX2TJW2_9PROT|nr:HAD family hydrolase [Azospirillum oleiclasticum]NYZ24641.1 HAD family hydrolase [Azospirillum oleiclasticum]